MRKFAGHGVLVLAAFASIATSKPKWHLEAQPPPTQIPDGSGSLAVIEASQRPEDVHCNRRQEPYQPATLRNQVGTRYEYVCPPGRPFGDVEIAGSPARGCGKPEVPDEAFVRFVEIKPVTMWRAEATTTFPLITQNIGAEWTFASTFVEVGGATWSTIEASLAPDSDAIIERPLVMNNGPNRFDVTIEAHDKAQHRAVVQVHAVGYGLCDQDCTPGQLTVERAR